jgi:chlorobactene glucosyltransferase
VRLHHLLDLLPAAPWLLPFLTLPRLARRTPSLADAPEAPGQLVSIIVPARNEAENIATVVRSLLETSYEPMELIVVDDRSTDETAAIVAGLPRDTRLRLIRGEELPSGWYGKPWACLQGFRHARGELLLFTDADTRHQPELLARAVGQLHRVDADLLTVAPTQLCLTFWERLVMPQIWFLLSLRYHPHSVSRARRPRDVIANGQFILTTRQAYETAGCHAAVAHEVAEDLALAQVYVRKGLRLHFAFAERLMETRM